MTFRKDINGLRAIAVLAVVLFHFKVKGFGGGFSGVDVFFVISGYLMTGIIFSRIRKNTFSILDFYVSRAKRIIPALAVLCIILLILGNFYLDARDYHGLLKNIKHSILFTSNISYSYKTDYFATPSQENWLLHTWSLSVEWQFYILYPVIIVLLHRFFKESTIKTILLIAALSSFTIASIYVYQSPTSTFYLLPTRAWEMLAGGIVFLFPLTTLTKKTRVSFELLGLLLIIFGILHFHEGVFWPSYLTLVPVIGTMMILYGNRESFITSNAIAQFIGKISYSTYLWHWPIAVLLYYCGVAEITLYIILGIIISFILATLSYYFVEQFFLRKKNTRLVALIKYLSVIILLGTVISPSIASYVKKHKYPNKDTTQTQQNNTPSTNQCFQSNEDVVYCEFGKGKTTAIIIGDSHTDAISSAIQLTNPGKTIVWARGGCPILENFHFKSTTETDICHKYRDSVSNYLQTQYPHTPLFIVNRASMYPDPIDLGGHFARFDNIDNYNRKNYLATYRKAYINTVCEIAKNRPVYIVKPIPEMRTNVVKSLQMQRHFVSNLSDIVLPIKKYNERHSFVLSIMEEAQKQCDVKLLDPTTYLCPNGETCMGSKSGVPLYGDDNHLSLEGSSLLTPLFEPIFDLNTHPTN